MKKSIVFFLLLICFAGTLFFIGWVQFSVPAGTYGVLVSKTGGIDPNPIISSRFRWQWERLIPTNSKLYIFDPVPFTTKADLEGVLPSGALYSKMLEGNPDFSWKTTLTVTARLNPSALPRLVDSFHIQDQAALDSWTKTQIDTVTKEAVRTIIGEIMQNKDEYEAISSNPAKLTQLITQKIGASEQQEIELVSITAEIVRIPDYSLYALAAKTYTDFQERRSALVSQTAAKQASESVGEYLQIERLAKWGEVLTKYPILIDFLAVSRDDAAAVFKTLKERP